ncbi:peptidoglycan DD-metalloendopeptidase family protein [Streptomyces sp. NPDC059708]|uniref:peptidoglycan DD-metalloendopeptidase family protein n=1 Tax=Streptomyces sp. NPDC059708 TaxID=3346916 RepID=UPI0036CA774C
MIGRNPASGVLRRALPVLLSAAVALLPGTAVASPSGAAGFAAACPTTGFISQGYSPAHNGIDIANDYGTPIFAVGDGRVTISGYDPGGYGQWIRVLHPDGTITEYGHMYQRDVAVGDHVVAGQRIALMGSEGNSEGPHLHLRVWADPDASVRTDPVPYLAERGVGMPCTPGTGPRPRPLEYPAESGRVVSARSADGRLEVFAAGADGVHHAWQTAVNGAWSDWEPLSGPGGAELAIGPNADGRLELFAINGNTFQHRYQLQPSGGWSGWETFGGGGHDIAAGTNADGRLEVFASGPVGIFHRYQTAPNAGWADWEPAGGGPANSRIEMEKSPDGRLEVFALNGDTFQHQYQTAANGAWSSWETFGGGGHDLTVDHNQDGRLEVFASGPVGVFHKYQTSATAWSDWEGTGGPAGSQLTSHRTADGRVEVFAINGTTAQHTWQTGVNAAYGPWDTFGGGGTEVIATSNQDGRIEVFGTSGAGVHHKWQTGFSTWSDWTWLNGTSGPAVN